MTDAEFSTFARRLFIAFPSLYEWMNGTIDPEATQAVWRACLRPYYLAECLGVVDAWSTGESKPFEAYERDKVHLMIRSMIGLQRDRARKRSEVHNRSKEHEYKPLPNTPYTDATMVSVYKKLAPIYAKMQAGEITVTEYTMEKEREFEKL